MLHGWFSSVKHCCEQVLRVGIKTRQECYMLHLCSETWFLFSFYFHASSSQFCSSFTRHRLSNTFTLHWLASCFALQKLYLMAGIKARLSSMQARLHAWKFSLQYLARFRALSMPELVSCMLQSMKNSHQGMLLLCCNWECFLECFKPANAWNSQL